MWVPKIWEAATGRYWLPFNTMQYDKLFLQISLIRQIQFSLHLLSLTELVDCLCNSRLLLKKAISKELGLEIHTDASFFLRKALLHERDLWCPCRILSNPVFRHILCFRWHIKTDYITLLYCTLCWLYYTQFAKARNNPEALFSE